MNYPWINEYCLAKKAVQKDFKDEWQCYRYMIKNKMFVMLGHDNSNKSIITIKCIPEYGDLLRTINKNVVAGYYMNKIHWNSVYLDGDLPDDLLKDMIDQSYDLILKSLTKKLQQEIKGS